jgi:hypothetical protein
LEDLERERILGGIRAFVDGFPLQDLQRGDLREDVSDDFFLEGLINNIRNETISHQIFISNSLKKSRLELTEKIKQLKLNYNENIDEIIEREIELSKKIEDEARTELENNENFEYLNHEKITPYFVKLAKGSKSEAEMDDICDSDGNPFNSATDRKKFIVDFYANLYKKEPGEPESLAGCIEQFLGAEICNNKIVKESKIPANLARELDLPISLIELDESVKQGNKSAAGMDGLSNCFIKKFWRFLRIPVHRYTTYCINNGSLTHTFRTAKIKIIPKKGDTTRIGNWRPISLLSCLYKVVSRALNNRLKKTRDFTMSRAQKGFTSERYIQEVLINVIENIAHCKKNNISACILSIDQSKAFDSVSHLYMREVYKFFGFGSDFIRIIETLCNNRTACISFDDGTLSEPFDLGRGEAQGNTPSPVLYNMGEQILLFKLELCPEISSVFNHFLVPRNYLAIEQVPEPVFEVAAPDQEFRNESNRETDNSDAFADDTSILTLFTYTVLLALKTCLENFGVFSGLKCNIEKTVLMQVGNKTLITPEIASLGFTFSDSIKILGMDIDSDISRLDSNFEKIAVSIDKSIAYWERYNLTLPGRINVAKSLLVSLLNYLGCFLMPSRIILKKIQTSIDDFTVGRLNVARNRITIPLESGGLGMFKLDDFLRAQQCMWVLRAAKSQRDNWRTDLYRLTFGNPLITNRLIICSNRHPILYGFAESFELCRINHDSSNENYEKMFVLYNPLLYRSARDKRRIDLSFLDTVPDPDQYKKLALLKFGDCYDERGLRTRVDLNISLGLNLSVTGYANLGSALNFYKNRRIGNENSDGTGIRLDMSLNIKKPAQKIRKAFVSKQKKTFKLSTQTTVVSFFRITEMDYIGDEVYARILKSWYGTGTNRYRMFVFKFFNNILGINTRTFHFGTNVTRRCLFCFKAGRADTDETFLHLFLTCPTVTEWHNEFLNSFIAPLTPLNLENRKKLFFLGYFNNEYNSFLASAVYHFQFSIWEEKLGKKLPAFITLKTRFLERYRESVHLTKKLQKAGTKINIPLCRYILRAGPPPEG